MCLCRGDHLSAHPRGDHQSAHPLSWTRRGVTSHTHTPLPVLYSRLLRSSGSSCTKFTGFTGLILCSLLNLGSSVEIPAFQDSTGAAKRRGAPPVRPFHGGSSRSESRHQICYKLRHTLQLGVQANEILFNLASKQTSKNSAGRPGSLRSTNGTQLFLFTSFIYTVLLPVFVACPEYFCACSSSC